MDSFSDTLYHYSMKYRGIVKADGAVTVYTERGSFPCSAEMEFDSKKDTDTAVNYFSAGLLSGILHGILSYMKKNILYQTLSPTVDIEIVYHLSL